MADTYVYIIHEPDWDSDEFLGRPRDHEGSADNKFPEHAAFAEAVAKLGATMTGGQALQNLKYGGSVVPGAGDRKVRGRRLHRRVVRRHQRGHHRLLPGGGRRRGPGPADRRAGADRQPDRVAQGLPDGRVTIDR